MSDLDGLLSCEHSTRSCAGTEGSTSIWKAAG